ncbi:MAG: glycerol acyltransferase [Richelia sp. RM2_1_2]|nr:glycerol acyltransferase [Richelia sp. RM1_1_1]NJO27657.1 glycerol acyltransferase [Richelia sp. SL_2_1]NJO59260.1 glycerol acyltransferase [Richelia sp. RM2_1_2]
MSASDQHSHKIYNPQFQQKSVGEFNFGWFDWFCLWYPPGWLILFNRHWQHYHDDPDGWNWLEYILFLIPCGFYLALLIRWLRLGCRVPCTQQSEFNPNYQTAFREEILQPIVKYYFHGELQQIENIPQHTPIIVAMNHAGMCFPWDILALGYLLSKQQGWVVYPLAGIDLFENPWMTWWVPSGWSKVLGGVKAKYDDFEAAIEQRKIILYAPEGLRGPGKGWKKRYQLEKFDISFIQLSKKYQVPILPVICIGSENLHPYTLNISWLQKTFHLPFLPISPLIPWFAIFPSMGVWAGKTKLRYFIQPLAEVNNVNNRGEFYQKAQELRQQMQTQINRLLSEKSGFLNKADF